MMQRLSAIVTILLVCLTRSTSSDTLGWQVKDFPESNGARIGDPDGIIKQGDLEKLQDKIQTFESTHGVLVDGESVPVQIAVALVNKMNLLAFGRHDDDREEKAAKAFATHLHDTWGVGHKTSIGGTGAFIFLSTHDRVIYISRGGALDNLLTDSRIDRIILGLRPILKQGRYGDALLGCIEHLAHFLKQGEPTFWEKFWDIIPNLIPLFIGGLFALFFALGIRKQNEERRTYAQVSSQLSQLDRSQAEARQGQYCATSCPICLEDFASTTVGSDELPIKLLRCGHVFDETCWSEWVGSGQGDVTKCPICQTDVGAPAVNNAQADTTNRHRVVVDDDQLVYDDHGVDNDRGGALRHRVVVDQLVHDNDHGAAGNDYAIRQFHRERNFRLARLAMRYPRYIRPQQMQRWTQSTYSDSLVRDPSFVQSDPKVVQQQNMNRANSRGGGHSSFGGGGSSGGRSGRW
jgi:uncharacterized membrane protein YgcG